MTFEEYVTKVEQLVIDYTRGLSGDELGQIHESIEESTEIRKRKTDPGSCRRPFALSTTRRPPAAPGSGTAGAGARSARRPRSRARPACGPAGPSSRELVRGLSAPL